MEQELFCLLTVWDWIYKNPTSYCVVVKYKAFNAVSKIFSKKKPWNFECSFHNEGRLVLSSANSRNYGIIAIPTEQGIWICFMSVSQQMEDMSISLPHIVQVVH